MISYVSSFLFSGMAAYSISDRLNGNAGIEPSVRRCGGPVALALSFLLGSAAKSIRGLRHGSSHISLVCKHR
jgi:hypothetical protein